MWVDSVGPRQQLRFYERCIPYPFFPHLSYESSWWAYNRKVLVCVAFAVASPEGIKRDWYRWTPVFFRSQLRGKPR